MEKRAYNALLTLLDDGSVSKKRRKETNVAIHDHRSNDNGDAKEIEGQEGLNADDEQENDDEEIDVDDDHEGDKRDPFEFHFASPPSDLHGDEARTAKWHNSPVDLKLLGPRSILSTPPHALKPEPHKVRKFEDLKIKHRLTGPWARLHPQLTESQLELATSLFGYQDVFCSTRTKENGSELRNLYLLHAINHIYKTRDRVLKNNLKTKEDEELNDDDTEKLRDQGFTRPKVLFLVPTRHAAYQVIEDLYKVSGLRQFENRKRFVDAFGGEGPDLSSKPADFQETFAGNTDDMFCLGLKFTRQALKLYSSFYQSDIIIASPLGLRMLIGKGDFDYLSSIELLVADQVDAIYMQSWQNMTEILEHMNQMPKESHGCDFSRIRHWYLDNNAGLLRQTVLLGAFATPEMVSAFSKHCFNIAGRLRCRDNYQGALRDIGIRVRQVFTRLGPHSFKADMDRRFDHFTTVVLPSILRGAQMEGTLIVVPSYLEFVRVRNYLEHKDMSFMPMSEYTSMSLQSRGRAYFADGRAKILLYSARLHHYRRYNLKGVRNIVFYGLPDNPRFYIEIVRYLARTVIEQGIDPDILRVQVVYSKWDALKLERIVGTSRLGTLLEGASDMYVFQ